MSGHKAATGFYTPTASGRGMRHPAVFRTTTGQE